MTNWPHFSHFSFIFRVMRIVIIVLSFFLLLDVRAQPPRDSVYYLNSRKISKAAKDYYNGKFKASDDARTFSILDSLKTNDDSTRPFYIYLASKMMKKSDGALSEELGVVCKDFIEWHPNEAIAFLYSNKTMASREFIDNWAKTIAGEFRIDCEGKEKPCVKASLNKATVKCSEKNKKYLQDLFDRIEIFVKS